MGFSLDFQDFIYDYFSIANLKTKRASKIVIGVMTTVSKNEWEAKLPREFRIIIPNITHIPMFDVLLNLPFKIYPDFTATIEINTTWIRIDTISKRITSSCFFNRPPHTKSYGKMFSNMSPCMSRASVLMARMI